MNKSDQMSKRAVAVGPNDLQIDVRAKGDTEAPTSPHATQKTDSMFHALILDFRSNPASSICWVLFSIVAGLLCGTAAASLSMELPPDSSVTVNVNANLLSAPVAAAKPGVLLAPVQESKAVPKSTSPLTADQQKANAKECADCKKAMYTSSISCSSRIERYQKDMNEKAAYHAVGGAALHGKFVCAACKRCDPTVV